MIAAALYFGAAAALIAAFGRSALVRKPDGRIVLATATEELPVELTGASFVKAGDQYFDAVTFQEITPAEALARSIREGMAMP